MSGLSPTHNQIVSTRLRAAPHRHRRPSWAQGVVHGFRLPLLLRLPILHHQHVSPPTFRMRNQCESFRVAYSSHRPCADLLSLDGLICRKPRVGPMRADSPLYLLHVVRRKLLALCIAFRTALPHTAVFFLPRLKLNSIPPPGSDGVEAGVARPSPLLTPPPYSHPSHPVSRCSRARRQPRAHLISGVRLLRVSSFNEFHAA